MAGAQSLAPADYLQQTYFYRYVQKREEWSARIGRTSKWEGTYPWVGTLATKLTKLTTSMAASTVTTMWHKMHYDQSLDHNPGTVLEGD